VSIHNHSIALHFTKTGQRRATTSIKIFTVLENTNSCFHSINCRAAVLFQKKLSLQDKYWWTSIWVSEKQTLINSCWKINSWIYTFFRVMQLYRPCVRNRTCGPAIPVQRSNKLSYRDRVFRPPGTRRCFNVEIWLKKGRDVDNLISTLLWRCFTNVGSTAANRRWINVRLWLVIRRQLVKYSQRCFNVVQRWIMVDEIGNLISTLFQRQKSNVNPICIFNLFSTSLQRLGDNFQRWFNVE
jgi:hypothetical protein